MKKQENITQAPNINTAIDSDKSPSWLIFLLMAAAFLLYANTLWHGYAFDDSIVIVDNNFTKKGLAGIKELVSQDFFNGIYGEKGMELTGGRYRPLSLVMFAVEYHYFPNQPFVGHFINVLFYSLTVGLLFFWLQKLFKQSHLTQISATTIAFIASLLFLAHPIHTEIVANIKSRDEIMGFFFMLLALLSVDKIAKNEGSALSYLNAAGCFMLALLSKENAIVFILIIPVLYQVFYKKSIAENINKNIILLATVFGYLLLRNSLVGSVAKETNLDIMENPLVGQNLNHVLGTVGIILSKYLLLSLAPITMSSDYSYNQIPIQNLLNVGSLAAWALYLLAGIYSIWALFKRKWLAFPILLYLLPLGLVCNLLFNVGAPMADRFLYLSTAGLCIGLAGYFIFLIKISTWVDFLKHKLLLLVIAIIFLCFSYHTFNRNKVWYNNETLFAADVKNSPNSAKIHYYYGNTMLKKYLDNPQDPKAKNYLDIAEKEMLRAYQINPKFPTNTYNVGLVYWNKENGKEAEKYLLALLSFLPTHINGNELLGKVYGRFLNNPPKAIYHLEKVIYEFKKPNVDNYRSLSIVYAQQNQLDKALNLCLEALKLAPEDAVTWQNLAAIYSARGEMDKAADAAQKMTLYQAKK
jgi:protein O-mannosyl-transferase